MKINTEDIVSLSEANQNFSKVIRTVDEKGSVIILKNNRLHYVVIDFKKIEHLGISVNENLETTEGRIRNDNFEAFKELSR